MGNQILITQSVTDFFFFQISNFWLGGQITPHLLCHSRMLDRSHIWSDTGTYKKH